MGLTPFHRPRAFAGTAVTVHTRPMIHRVFDFCRPGDVLVIDGGGDLNQALMGDIMASYAESIGVAVLVIDGAICDVSVIRAHDFPVYARGVTHRGPYKNGLGEINVPVTVGGMVVHPGDIVMGDEDGVFAIAQQDAAEVIEKARVQEQKEAQALQAIAEGRLDRGWVAGAMERAMKG